MKTRRLSEDQTIRWAIFINKPNAPENVISGIEGWGLVTSEDLDDTYMFDSEKEALEMKETIDKHYPQIKEYIYVDCFLCFHDDKDPQEQLQGWRDWWKEHGSSWYMDGEFPQETKPPELKSDSDLYIG